MFAAGLHSTPPTHPALTHPFQARDLQEDKKPGTFYNSRVSDFNNIKL